MSDQINSRLEDALTAAQYIQQWVGTATRTDLDTNVMLESALLLQLERIGEALRIVRSWDDSIEERFPGIHTESV